MLSKAGLQAREVLNDLFATESTITTFVPYLKVPSAISETTRNPVVLLDDYMQGSVPDPPAAL